MASQLCNDIQTPFRNTVEVFGVIMFVWMSAWMYQVIAFRRRGMRTCSPRIPPTLPYFIPFWGSTLSFILQPRGFMEGAGKHLGMYMPVRIRLLFGYVYIIRGKDNIASLWKESVNSNYTELLGFMLDRMFNMPPKALALWRDDSGFLQKPCPQSATAPNNRVDHITHEMAHELLLNPRSEEIATRFSALLQEQLAKLGVRARWEEMNDLMEFFQLQMTAANIEAMYGPSLRSQHPRLCEDFWLFNKHIGAFCRHFPKWIVNWTIPDACRARSRILQSIKYWQRSLRSRNTVEKGHISGGAYWGPDLIRKWHSKLLGMDGFDEDAIASLYFAIIWVSNVNIIPSAFWIALELYRDPSTLAEARSAVDRCVSYKGLNGSPNSDFLTRLTKEPILQSIFAETLRLRTHAYITRYFSHNPILLSKQWLIPQRKICLLSTQPAHHDETVWNTRNGEFPLDTFWARRFLIDQDDPFSGPTKPNDDHNSSTARAKRHRADSATSVGLGPKFTTDGLSASWIPFGGGPRACPGRHVAKRQVLATIAFVILNFDIEITAGQDAWKMDESGYGPGVQRPVARVPFRIRRRSPN